VGTSAGALNVAHIASRPQTVTTAEELERVWRGLHSVDILPINPRAVISGDDPPSFSGSSGISVGEGVVGVSGRAR
jgi:hypothetical protein